MLFDVRDSIGTFSAGLLFLGKHSYLQVEPARYTELGACLYLETLTIFVSPPKSVSLGGEVRTKKG